MPSDLNQGAFACNQSNMQPAPNTLAAAATIAPSHALTIITGTTAVANITPPLAGFHVLYMIWTDGSPGTTLTTGNIENAVIPTQDVPSMFIYNPNSGKYRGWANNLT